jgi:uncharacterized protein
MPSLQHAVDDFLAQRRIAVAGVSRQPGQAANAIFRKLRTAGYDVFAVNPGATEVEGGPCFPDLASIPEPVDAVVAVTPPAGTEEVVRQCVKLGIGRLWIHGGMGPTSVSAAAVAEARAAGMTVIPGACPMMFVAPVDPFHKCLRGFRRMRGRLPEPVTGPPAGEAATTPALESL